MARRFIVKSDDLKVIDNDRFVISGSEVKHIQVLRHNIGDEIVINKFICKITKMTNNTVEVDVLKEAEKKGEPKTYVTLYMGMIKNDKMDYVIQKAVELGVKEIVPFFSKNVVVKLDEKGRKKRIEKFQVIANEACKQCGRTDEVLISNFIDYKELSEYTKNNDANILAYENNEEEHSLKNFINMCKENNYKNIGYIIGPEGGFDVAEINNLPQNTKIVSLGDRILRAETAALNVISIIMYEIEL